MATFAAKNLPDNGSYTGDNIKILEGLEAVRLRPAMYIGSTGEMGLHHLVYEVVDNSVDEALAGYAKKIDVIIHVDNSITVVDDGRGIPVDMKTLPNGEKMPSVQVVLTKLHAGGKFDSSTYKVSGGLHGVGVSCVNALSQEFNVEIWRDDHTWEMDFSCGLPTSELRKAGISKKRGTKVHFLPDKSDLHRHRVQLRHAGAAAARARLPQQGPRDHAHRRAHRRRQDRRVEARRVQLRRRHRRVRQASQPRQAGAARQADHDGSQRATRSKSRSRCNTTTATPKRSSASPTTSTPSTAARISPDSARR